MKELFLMLFFAKVFVLTPHPIDISNNWYEINVNEPLKAITGGATIVIDVSDSVKGERDVKKLDVLFPPKLISVVLEASNHSKIKLFNGSAYSFQGGKTEIIMLSKAPIPTNLKYVKVLIKSKKKINNVIVKWRNSSK